MRPQKVKDDELIDNLSTLFRTKGYAATSINDIALHSGLKKASLYHRFSGGKKDMALAVFSYSGKWIETNVFHILTDDKLEPEKRLSLALKNIRDYYQNGLKPCLLRSLSMQTDIPYFQRELYNMSQKWINAWKKLGVDFKFPIEDVDKIALHAFMLIQGSLVLCKTLKDTYPFDDALNQIQSLYTNNLSST